MRKFTIKELKSQIGPEVKVYGCTNSKKQTPNTILVSLAKDQNFCNVKLVKELDKRNWSVSISSACN
ncbi:MAG: hypothetical protein ACO293_08375, partial [Nitrosopumilaceae archaeon]